MIFSSCGSIVILLAYLRIDIISSLSKLSFTS